MACIVYGFKCTQKENQKCPQKVERKTKYPEDKSTNNRKTCHYSIYSSGSQMFCVFIWDICPAGTGGSIDGIDALS